jgi:phosphoribosylformylglycinamidine (FGAM) synthase PurS component
MIAASTHKIEVSLKSEYGNAESLSAAAVLKSANAPSVTKVRKSRLYEIRGNFTVTHINRLSRDLLCDPITEDFRILSQPPSTQGPFWKVEVRLKPTVLDPEADTVKNAMVEMGFPAPDFIRIAAVYKIESKCGKPQIEAAAIRSLLNPVINLYSITACS